MAEDTHDPTGEGDHQPEPVEEPTTQETTGQAIADFSSGEGMVAFAGLALLAVWLVFDVITDDYSVTNMAVVLAGAAAVLPRMNRASVEKVMPLPSAMKLVGFLLAIVGVVEVVGDIDSAIFDDPLPILAALLAYVAYAMAFLGARNID